jgi:hypothetical protein
MFLIELHVYLTVMETISAFYKLNTNIVENILCQ